MPMLILSMCVTFILTPSLSMAAGPSDVSPIVVEATTLSLKAAERSQVLRGIITDNSLNFALPVEYPICFHAASIEAQQQGRGANEYLLKQIDFLKSIGLSDAAIRAINAYGDALLRHDYFVKNELAINQLDKGTQSALVAYSRTAYTAFGCSALFGGTELDTSLKELIQTAIGAF